MNGSIKRIMTTALNSQFAIEGAVLRVFMSIVATVVAITSLITTSVADDLPIANPFLRYSNPHEAVLAVQTKFNIENGMVHVSVYENADQFLKTPKARLEATLDDTGLALFSLAELNPQDYSFVVYLDENIDGRLNRNLIGKPNEPFIFSNGIRPNLRKPTFDETKVSVFPGAVIVMTIEK